MIGLIAGAVEHVAEDHVLVDVGGIGYEVHCHAATLASLPASGGAARLYTDLEVRPESMRLYGFTDPRERAWFRLLKTVPGVGAKGALAVLGVAGADGLADAIALGDSQPLRRAPGIGPRIAARMVQELKGRAPDGMMLAAAPAQPAGARREALSALVNLGYSPAEASRAVQEAAGEAGEDVERMLHRALQRLGKGHG